MGLLIDLRLVFKEKRILDESLRIAHASAALLSKTKQQSPTGNADYAAPAPPNKNVLSI